MKKTVPEFDCDLHCHTVMSKDAVSTLYEVASEAKRKKLKIIAIVEHGPGMRDGPHPEFFSLCLRIPSLIKGVVILWGCESNVIDLKGNIDLAGRLAKMQDIVVAGIHKMTDFPASSSRTENTKAIIKAMDNPHVDIVAHPYRDEFPTDIRALVARACDTGVLLELNASLLRQGCSADVLANIRLMVELCAKRGYPLALGSDAHVASEVGDYTPLRRFGINITRERVWSPEISFTRLSRKISASIKHGTLVDL